MAYARKKQGAGMDRTRKFLALDGTWTRCIFPKNWRNWPYCAARREGVPHSGVRPVLPRCHRDCYELNVPI